MGIKTIHYIYKIHFLCGYPSGRYYIGKHTHHGLLESDKYAGSGTFCKSYFKKYGKILGETYIKEIIEINPSHEINVNREEYYIGELYKTDPLCMNLIKGGVCANIPVANKKVIQYDIDGNMIAKFHSQCEAANSVGLKDSSCISSCCINKNGTAAGYIWRFENDDISIQKIKSKKISQYDKLGNFIKTYKTIKEASESSGIFASSIGACCKGKRNSAGGFIWKYWNEALQDDDLNKQYNEERPVIQYDLDGNFISEYKTMGCAAKTTGIVFQRIQHAVNQKYGTAGKYIWRDKSNPLKTEDIKYFECKKKRYICKYSIDNRLIAKYISQRMAAADNGIRYQDIQYSIKTKRPKGGFIWKYGEVIE